MKENWTYKKLGEIATLINGDRGKNYPSTNDFIPFGVPFINAGHIQKGKVDFSEMNYISEEKFDSLRSGKVSKGDILFCLRGSLGKTALVNIDNGAIASSLVIIRSHSDNPQFIQYYLQSNKIKELIQKNNNGSSQPNLSATSVAGFSIFIPPLSEQSRIVSELDLLQSIIDKQQAQLKELDTLAQAVFFDMFGDPVENEKGWEVKKMGEIGTIERGAGISKKDFTENGLPCIHYGQLHTCLGATTYKHRTCIPENLMPKYKIAHPGDVVMAITSEDVDGSCKSTAWLGNYDIIVGSDAAIYHHNMNGVFISYYTQTKAFYDEKAKYAKGFKVTHISATEIESIPIPVPPLSLQQKFATKIEVIEKQKTTIAQSIAETQKLFNYTMDKYFG